MPKTKSRQRKPPKRVLALPDREHAKAAVLTSLTSVSGQRTYDHAITEFVAWYCSEPRLAFNRTMVLRYRIHLEQQRYAPATITLRLAAVRRVAYEAADAGLLSPGLAAGIRRVKGVRRLGVRLGNWLTPEQGRRLLAHDPPAAARDTRDQAMVAMRIGCGLRRSELLGLRLESVQQREDHWVIAGLIGKGGHVRTVPIPAWVKTTVDVWTTAAGITHGPVSVRSIGPDACGARACRPRCFGASCGPPRAGPASRNLRRMIVGAPVRVCATWPVANWIRSSSSWVTSPSKRQSGTSDASSGSGAR